MTIDAQYKWSVQISPFQQEIPCLGKFGQKESKLLV